MSILWDTMLSGMGTVSRPRKIEEYVDARGRSPFGKWLTNLKDVNARALIRKRLNRVRIGNFGNCRSVGDDVKELKPMPKRTKNYEDSLLDALKDPVEAVAYLNTHLEDKGDDSEELFLMALRDVAKAHGFSKIAEISCLGRESLYKALSKRGNPRLRTVSRLLDAMGLKMSIQVQSHKRKSA